ncbi:hypothetical protein IIA79_01900 [bacterium]|nr:hypothetical protein [bacterium]
MSCWKDGHASLGNLNYDQGRMDEAQAGFEQALAIYSELGRDNAQARAAIEDLEREHGIKDGEA